MKYYRIKRYPCQRGGVWCVVEIEMSPGKWVEPNWDAYGFPELSGLFTTPEDAIAELRRLSVEMWKLGLAPLPHTFNPVRLDINAKIAATLLEKGLVALFHFKDAGPPCTPHTVNAVVAHAIRAIEKD